MITLLILLVISFLVTAGVVWAVCWALAALSIVTIVWSWKMAFAVWILVMAFRWLFK